MAQKQVQDAYIVAATRTPIGRSGRGYFKNTRPDDLLVAAVKTASAHRASPRCRWPPTASAWARPTC